MTDLFLRFHGLECMAGCSVSGIEHGIPAAALFGGFDIAAAAELFQRLGHGAAADAEFPGQLLFIGQKLPFRRQFGNIVEQGALEQLVFRHAPAFAVRRKRAEAARNVFQWQVPFDHNAVIFPSETSEIFLLSLLWMIPAQYPREYDRFLR